MEEWCKWREKTPGQAGMAVVMTAMPKAPPAPSPSQHAHVIVVVCRAMSEPAFAPKRVERLAVGKRAHDGKDAACGAATDAKGDAAAAAVTSAAAAAAGGGGDGEQPAKKKKKKKKRDLL